MMKKKKKKRPHRTGHCMKLGFRSVCLHWALSRIKCIFVRDLFSCQLLVKFRNGVVGHGVRSVDGDGRKKMYIVQWSMAVERVGNNTANHGSKEQSIV